MTDRASAPRANGTEQASAPQKALPPAGLGVSPRPWRIAMQRSYGGSAVYFLRIRSSSLDNVLVGSLGDAWPYLARAAVEALKNPPDAALDAMNPSNRYASLVIPEAWNDAIDAILSEGDAAGDDTTQG